MSIVAALTNVLTNCFCALPVRLPLFTPAPLIFLRQIFLTISQATYWWDRWTNPDALMFFGDNTYEQLYYARQWWVPTGVVGVALMTVVTYIGWWYQRSLRYRFDHLIEKIDHVNYTATA